MAAISREPNRLDGEGPLADDSGSNRLGKFPVDDSGSIGKRGTTAAQAAPMEQERSPGRELPAPPAPFLKPKPDKDFHSRQMGEMWRATVPKLDCRKYALFVTSSGRKKQDLMKEAWDDLLKKYRFGFVAGQQQTVPESFDQIDRSIHQDLIDLSDQILMDRSDLDGSIDQSEARQKEDAALKYYAELTNNRVQKRDRRHYRHGHTSKKGIRREGIADLPLPIILAGIRASVEDCQFEVLMFAYCLGRIHRLVEEQATVEGYAADERINILRGRQEILPNCAAPFDPQINSEKPATARNELTVHWHQEMAKLLSEESFTLWIMPATLQLEGAVPIITALNVPARDLLRANYSSAIDEALEQMGLQTAEVRWEPAV